VIIQLAVRYCQICGEPNDAEEEALQPPDEINGLQLIDPDLHWATNQVELLFLIILFTLIRLPFPDLHFS
jgi:hypothetical protein